MLEEIRYCFFSASDVAQFGGSHFGNWILRWAGVALHCWELPKLKSLGLMYLALLAHVKIDKGAMPQLQSLIIKGCKSLCEVSE